MPGEPPDASFREDFSRCFGCQHILEAGGLVFCTAFCSPATGRVRAANRRGTKGTSHVHIVSAMERCQGRFYRPAVHDPRMPDAR